MTVTPALAKPTRTLPEAKRLSVAVVDEELPFPVNSGKRIRTFNLLKHLAGLHEVTLIARKNRDPEELEQALSALQALGIRVMLADELVPAPSTEAHPARLYASLARNLFSDEPYLVAKQRSRVLTRLVQQLARERPLDVVHYEWTPLVDLSAAAGPCSVVVAHNIESTIWQRYAENERNPLKRWYIRRQWRKMQRFERRALRTATRAVAVSHTDRQTARGELGVESMEVVENGVDTEFFRSSDSPRREQQRFLFLGSLDWRPNLDAVGVILDELLPRLRSRFPGAVVEIVGRRAPVWLQERCRAEPALELHSDVPDVRPHLERCTAMLVPLRIGGGSRLKILEALAMETPVVSTSVGAEGLEVVHERHLAIAESAEAMTEELSRCILEPDRTRAWGTAGRRLVTQQYDWRALSKKLEAVWREAAATAGEGRCS